ncbi:PAS domain S-box protein [Pseudoalteromonas piratica]|uniref:PAS domain S-box protein n=1 Tax=Pseudoalteromonas piratica TaxID=1348114 RepID=UPI0006922920|nr:PAS domain S-box protein [Pseudoalteromonas piratica]
MEKAADLNVSLRKIGYKEGELIFPPTLSETELLSFLKLSTELAADEVFWMKSDSEIFYVNHAACEKLGYQREELVGMKVWEWDPLFPKEVWPTFWKELKEKKHIDFETQHQNKEGKVFPVRIKGHFIESNGEEILFAFVSDISDVKKHEKELQVNSSQMQALLEQEKKKFAEFVNLAPVGIAINKMDTGEFDYINDEFSRFTGYSIDELNTMDYWQLTPKKYEEQEYKQLADMAETGAYGPYQKEYIHKQGHTYPVLLSGIKITDSDGNDYIWSVVQDISQQQETEIELREAREKADANAFKMQIANDSAGIGVWEWNLETNALIWDDWMYKLYGIETDLFSGAYEAWENSVHPEDIEEAKAKLEAAIADTGVYDTEFRVVLPSGEIRTMKASAEVIKNGEGTPISVIGVNYDISEKVNTLATLVEAKREADRAAKAKSDFLANMSHEIRTPMNAILGGLQLLKNAELDQDLRTVLGNASFSAQSLLTIINDILDYSKIESNKLELEHAPFSINEILDSVKYDLDAQVSNKGIEFLVSVDNDFVDGWLGDLVRVKQILLNLASNAVKFTEKGSVEIKISEITYKSQQAICLNVIDSGIGMSEEVQECIFERFSQADTSTTRKYGGTGLGMSITISLIKLMGGELRLVSELNKGTDIQVVLPLKHEVMDKKQKITKSLTAPNLSDIKILIAEDNKINQVLIQSILKPTNASLTIVEDGQQAVDAVKEDKFDLVLMDIHMPNMDGTEAQLLIKELNPKLPVVALTANVMTNDIDSYLVQGFVAHVGKPIDMNNLYEVLGQFV